VVYLRSNMKISLIVNVKKPVSGIRMTSSEPSFSDLARAASATVGKIVDHGLMKGNGFMISDRLFLTNNHIIPDPEAAAELAVEFGCEIDNKLPKPTTKFEFAPDKFLMKSREEDLDFTIVAIGKCTTGRRRLSDFGFCPLKEKIGNYSLGDTINIIHHYGMEGKKMVLRDGFLVAQSEEVIHYYATVVSGSSGSPVFNAKFEPIALHHYGRPSRIAFAQDGKPGPKQIAEGIRIVAIVKRISSERNNLDKEQRRLVDIALAYPFSYPSMLKLR
jgi:endonuclease G